MKTMTGGAMILVATLTLFAGEVQAQQGARPGARGRAELNERLDRGPAAAGVEGILRMRERLELTDEQVARLDALRAERVERAAQRSREVGELQSRLRAGTAERTEVADQLSALRQGIRERAEADRAEVETILTEEQRATLQELQARRRAFEAGRRSGMREHGRALRGQERRPGPGALRPGGRQAPRRPRGADLPGIAPQRVVPDAGPVGLGGPSAG
jgi:Spy/CpxP family protein refolding chaperone